MDKEDKGGGNSPGSAFRTGKLWIPESKQDGTGEERTLLFFHIPSGVGDHA